MAPEPDVAETSPRVMQVMAGIKRAGSVKLLLITEPVD